MHERFSSFCTIFIEFVPQNGITRPRPVGVGKAVVAVPSGDERKAAVGVRAEGARLLWRFLC